MEILLYSDCFESKTEFLEYINSLGYKDFKSFECRTDKRVLDFVKDRTENYCGSFIMLGSITRRNLCGFNGFAAIREIEENRKFKIDYSIKEFRFNTCFEKITYIDDFTWYEFVTSGRVNTYNKRG